jgi:hypothetical protein
MPWCPEATLSVTTDAAGKVAGELVIPLPPGAPAPELVLAVSGRITPAFEGPVPVPEGIELTGEGGRGSVNQLRGYFVDSGAAGLVIVGTVVAVRNDPAGEPDGTSGPFVLVPAK